MRDEKWKHPDDALLARAVATDGPLPPELRKHLAECPECRAACRELTGRLDTLGRQAVRHLPPARRQVRLPSGVPGSRGERSHSRRVAGFLGAAVITAMLLAAVWLPLRRNTPPAPDGIVRNGLPAADEQLMMEVGELVENPLPDEYLDIIGETELAFGRDFLEYVAPVPSAGERS